jgi:Sensors of blue-light using FAD
MVYQLIYSSRFKPTKIAATSSLRDILRVSETNNYRDGLTGFLIFDKVSFVQVLEGHQVDVAAAYARIAADPRHDNLTVIAQRTVKARDFADWSMGGFIRGPEVEDLFALHGLPGQIDAHQLKAGQVLGLAKALLAHEQNRRQGRIINAVSPGQ